MKATIAHPAFSAHHRYQLEIILLFVFGFFLYFPFFLWLEEYNFDPVSWQWLLFWPWMMFFAVYSLYTRSKIPPAERQDPLHRLIGHWVMLGITLIALNLGAHDLRNLQSLDLAFVIFSLFLADSYWDFRNVRNAN